MRLLNGGSESNREWRRNQKAVQRQMKKGAAYPMRLSDYLENPRRAGRPEAEVEDVDIAEEVEAAL